MAACAGTVRQVVVEAVAAADLRVGVVDGRLRTTSPTASGRLLPAPPPS